MRSSIAVCVCVLFMLSGCGLKTVEGSGNVVVEQREVSGFSAVSMSGFGELIIQQTGKESLSITADDNLLPLLTSKVQGNQLVLGADAILNPTQPVVYRLEVGQLNSIGLSGSGTVR